MIEVWTRDEYGQASLQGRFGSKEEAMSKAMSVLDSMNSDNALTSNERERNWDCYMPVLDDSSLMLYAGKARGHINSFFNFENGDVVNSDSAKIVLGNGKNGMWIAKNHKNQEIANINDPALKMKSFIFFKKV